MNRGQSFAEMKAEITLNLTEAGRAFYEQLARDFQHHNARCAVVPQEDIIDVKAREVAEPLALPQEVE